MAILPGHMDSCDSHVAILGGIMTALKHKRWDANIAHEQYYSPIFWTSQLRYVFVIHAPTFYVMTRPLLI